MLCSIRNPFKKKKVPPAAKERKILLVVRNCIKARQIVREMSGIDGVQVIGYGEALMGMGPFDCIFFVDQPFLQESKMVAEKHKNYMRILRNRLKPGANLIELY